MNDEQKCMELWEPPILSMVPKNIKTFSVAPHYPQLIVEASLPPLVLREKNNKTPVIVLSTPGGRPGPVSL